MGGTTGLLIGASLLSFVEIFYYFSIRPYGSMMMNRKRQTVDSLKKIKEEDTSSYTV